MNQSAAPADHDTGRATREDMEKERRRTAEIPALQHAAVRAPRARWDAFHEAGVAHGLKRGSSQLSDWIAYWMTSGQAGRLP